MAKLSDSKEDKILAAAWKLFKRHGFKKVTLGEIAEAAGISRPTLYAVFDNKEALIDRFVREACLVKNAETERAISKEKDLRRRLEMLFEIWIVEPFISHLDNESFKELMTAVSLYAPEAVDESYEQFRKYTADLLEPHLSKRSKLGADELAQIIANATRGFKASARTPSELKHMVDGLILMTLNMFDKRSL